MTTSLRRSHIKFSLLSDVAGRMLAQPPSLTNISDTVSYFLARAFSKTWKKTKIYHGLGLPFFFFFPTFLFSFSSDKTLLDSLKKPPILYPCSHFQLSLRVWGEVRNALKRHLCRQHVNDTEVRFISPTPRLMDFLQSIYTYTHSFLCLHK